MSPSFMKKTMVYLGLLDDEYDEYDDLEDRAPRAFTAPRSDVRPQEQDQPEEYGGGTTRIRTMVPRESAVPSPTRTQQPSPVPRTSGIRPVPVETGLHPAGGGRESTRGAVLEVVVLVVLVVEQAEVDHGFLHERG